MSNNFPTSSVGEFITFCIVVFLLALTFEGICYGLITVADIFLNWGR